MFQGGPWANRLLDSAVTTAPEVVSPVGDRPGEYRRTEQQPDSSAVVYEWSPDAMGAPYATSVAHPDVREHERTRIRFAVEVVAAVVALALAIVTLFVPEWIEAVFRLSPDEGGGTLEWFVVFALAAISIGLTFAARRQWRRLTAAA